MKPLSRRTLLRGGAAVALSLPMLEAMLPKKAHAAGPSPRRFLSWSQPNGTVLPKWRPVAGATPESFTLSETLSPLERHKQDLVVVQNHGHPWPGGHHYLCVLTGRQYITIGSSYPQMQGGGISLDQYLAQKWAGQTPIPSLQLGVMVRPDDAQLTSCISWAGARQPMPAENNPYAVFGRLFGGGAPSAGTAARATLLKRRSILDSVLGQSHSLSQQLGAADKRVVDNYLESIRGVERELVALEQAQAMACQVPAVGADPSQPGQTPFWMRNENTPQVLSLQIQLATLAFECDLTRIITLVTAGSGAGHRTYPFVPGTTTQHDWHGFAHLVETGNDATMVAIDKWHVNQLATLIDGLKSRVQPSGKSLLYDTLVFSNNEYGPNGPVSYLPTLPDGTRPNLSHNSNMIPFLLLGQAGGSLRTGRNLVSPFVPGGAPRGVGGSLTRVLVSILNALGLPDTQFGDPGQAQGPVQGLA